MRQKGRPRDLHEPVTAGTKKESNLEGNAAVNDSAHGRELERHKEAIRSAPDIRSDVVEMIKRKINKGTYDVKAEDIAEKIIQTENLF